MGHKVDCIYEKALEKADVVVDCTPAGNENKKLMFFESCFRFACLRYWYITTFQLPDIGNVTVNLNALLAL